MIMSIQRYRISVKYRPGKELVIADTLSRAALPDEAVGLIYKEYDINTLTTASISLTKSNKPGSPSQRLMGQRTKTLLPTTESFLLPKIIEPPVVKKQLAKQKTKQKYYYDKPLSALNSGDKVMLKSQDTWKPAIVTTALKEPQSYKVTTPERQTLRQNRCHLIKHNTQNLNVDTGGNHTDSSPESGEPIPAPHPKPYLPHRIL